MKLFYSLILLFILCLVFQGCSLSTTGYTSTTGRYIGTVKKDVLLPVDFVKEGSSSPNLAIADKYINEIREKGVLLGSFSYNNKITIYLEPRDYEIQLCQSEKIIDIIKINPTTTREVRYNPSASDGFMEAGGKYLMLPIFLVTWPIWGPIIFILGD